MPGHRCVLGCKQTGFVLHCFPNPDKFPEPFKVWVDIAGGRLETPSDFEFMKKKMCDIHFKVEHKNRNKRLNALAVPCLYLRGELITPHSEAVNQRDSSYTALKATDASNISSVLVKHNYIMLSRCERKKVATMGCQSNSISNSSSDSFRQRLVWPMRRNDIHFRRLIKDMKKPVQLFTNMQKQQKINAKGTRFTNEEKILCLSL